MKPVPIQFLLNGELRSTRVRPDTTVLEYLRTNARLTGTKEGCAEGDCGACSVLLGSPDKSAKSGFTYQPVNGCILLMGQVHGAALITVEGLSQSGTKRADEKSAIHPVQAEMAVNGSSQCGFCTPGIVVSLAGLLERVKSPNEEQIHDALAGNLCRCTGYRPIVDAAYLASKAKRPRLTSSSKKLDNPVALVGNNTSIFHLPRTMPELLKLRAKHKDAILLAGGTDLSLAIADARERWKRVILTQHVVPMKRIVVSKTKTEFGGAVTWEEALPHLEKVYPSFAALVRRFGSIQIRSQGTIAGNIGTASPIGDGAPALIALGASIKLASDRGTRKLPLEDYFLGYRKTELRADEVIVSISLPLKSTGDHFRTYKVSKRFDQDISTVCGAFQLTMKDDVVKSARIAYGGMAAIPKRCSQAEQALIGKPFTLAICRLAQAEIEKSFEPLSDWRGTADYRRMVASNLLERLFRDIDGETVEVHSL